MRDVFTSDTASMERTHGKLSTWLANGLSSNNAHCRTNIHGATGGKIPTIALLANAVFGMARHDSADNYFNDAGIFKRLHLIHRGNIGAASQDHATILGNRIVKQAAANEVLVQISLFVVNGIRHTVGRSAIDLTNDNILSHVYQTTSQITRVGSTQSRVSQTLTSTMGGNKVLQNRQTLAEVCLNGSVDNLALRVRHQATHTS